MSNTILIKRGSGTPTTSNTSAYELAYDYTNNKLYIHDGASSSMVEIGGLSSINNSNWSGTDLAVEHGGTGASTFTSNAILTGNGTNAIQAESQLTFASSFLELTDAQLRLDNSTFGTYNWEFQQDNGGDLLFKVPSTGGAEIRISADGGSDSWKTTEVLIAGEINLHADGTSYFKQGATPLVLGGTSAYTTGGTPRLSIQGAGLNIGSGTNDMSYMRRIATGEYQWQTWNGANDGELHLQPYGGKVGIGSAAPEALLHVKAADTVTGRIKIEGGKNTVTSSGEINSSLDFGSNDTSVGGSGDDANVGGRIASVTENTNGAWTGMAFSTFKQTSHNLREVMRLDNLGRLGIGTTSPLGHLDINTEASEATKVYINGEGSQDKLLLFRHYGNSEAAGASAYLGFIGSIVDNVLSLGHYTASGTELGVMHITEVGKVGIGQTSPTTALEVIGDIKIKQGAGYGNYSLIDATEAVLTLETYSVNTSNHSGDIIFKPAGTERMRIGDDGVVDISGSLILDTALAVAEGGTGATSAHNARINLGLGNLAELNQVTAATIADNNVGAAELNVSGNGSSGQVLASDGDGSFSWVAQSAGDATTLDGLDSTRFFRRDGAATATVGPGWMTVAYNSSGRRAGEVLVTDGDSGDHGFIRIHWLRSYMDSNFTVINCGGHANRITGVRVLSQDSDNTYGTKLLQVYVEASSSYDVKVFKMGDDAHYTTHTVHTPVIENTKTGYSVHGNQLENLDTYGFAHEEGILAGGHLNVGSNVYTSDGSASAPAYSFDSDTNTGIYRAGSDDMRFVAGGDARFSANGNGLDLSVSSAGKIVHNSTSSRDKYRLWTASAYAIGMQNSFTFGGLDSDYAMTFQMSNTASRGFWFGDNNHGQAGGAMAVTTEGKLTVAHSMRLGYGETDQTTPGSTFTMDISGNNNLRLASGSDQMIRFARSGGNEISIEHDANQMYFYNRATSQAMLMMFNSGSARIGQSANPFFEIRNTGSSSGDGGVLRFGHSQDSNTTEIGSIRTHLLDGSGAGRAGTMEFWTSHSGTPKIGMELYHTNYLYLYENGDTSDYMRFHSDSSRAHYYTPNTYHRFTTGSGYIELGPANTGWGHINTDRGKFYFNNRVVVDSGIIAAYDEDLSLRRNYNSSEGVNDRIDIADNAVKVYTDSENERFRFGSVNRSFTTFVCGPINNNSKAYIRANNGYSTATTPDYTWWYNDQCGIYHPAGNTIGFSANGEKVKIGTYGLYSASSVYVAHGGSDYTPNISFLGGSNTPGSNAYENAGIGYYDNSGTGSMKFFGNRGTMSWFFTDSDETLFNMASDGTFHAEADVVAYSQSTNSDRRLKEDINPIQYGLKEVLEINPVKYKWIEKRGGKEDIGVIAQDIEKIIPEIVQENKALNSDKMIKSVDYGKMVAVLIKAVQEQQEQINELKEKLNG